MNWEGRQLQDGFYLATYLNPVGLHRVANVRLRHDNNLSLWEKTGNDVRLVRHWELERISGQKMHRTPFHSIADQTELLDGLLAPLGLGLADMVEVWGTPGLSTADDRSLADAQPDLAFHAIAHLYSAILLDSDAFFDGTVVGLAVDRGPDRVLDRVIKDHWFAGCVVRRGQVELFPVESPGPLYCEARDRFGKREGSLMALATATKAIGCTDRARLLAEHRFDDPDAVDRSRAVFDQVLTDVRRTLIADPAFTELESLTSAVMKEVQAISVMIMERNLDRIIASYDVDPGQAHLAVAGGYALNCPTNSHLMNRYGFRRLLAPPSVGDDGQSVGIGLAAFHRKMPGRFRFRYPGPYLGREETDVTAALAGFARFVLDIGDYDERTAVDDLLAGPVVWLNGRSEVGPRALGNRSLLGDPCSPVTKEVLNRVKKREWWRPVAPVVLEDRVDEWFEDARPSPYMLETFTIRPERREDIPAVAHLDYSARIQSVSRAQNPELYDLVAAFGRRTGVPILCNTSLNDAGEPIIDTIAEAVNFCLRKRLSVAYFNGRRVRFGNFEDYRETRPLPRTEEPFAGVPPEVAARLRAEHNPYGLSDVQLYLYLTDLVLCDEQDIRTKAGAAVVGDTADARLAADPGLAASVRRAMDKNRVHFSAYGWQPLIAEKPVPGEPAGEEE
jgi:hypothetical protein